MRAWGAVVHLREGRAFPAARGGREHGVIMRGGREGADRNGPRGG